MAFEFLGATCHGTLYQLSYSPGAATNDSAADALAHPIAASARTCAGRAGGSPSAAPPDGRGVAVEALDLVEAADLVEEHVDDDVAVVEQHPLLLADALDAARRTAGRRPDRLLDLVDERAHEPPVGRVEHDEQLGDGEDLADVEDDDVAALLLVGGARGDVATVRASTSRSSSVTGRSPSRRRSPASVGRRHGEPVGRRLRASRSR